MWNYKRSYQVTTLDEYFEAREAFNRNYESFWSDLHEAPSP